MKEEKRKVRISLDNPSIQRINEKCINCGACFLTCEKMVGLDHNRERKDIPLCINCGQCVLVCPQGAIVCKYNYKRVLNIVKDTTKITTISIAPAVRVQLAEELGLDPSINLEGLLPSILRAIGFDYVFDVTFGADVCIMEEASELLYRIKNNGVLPMYTSCCPSWVKYASMFHPEILPNLSTTKSPIGLQSTIIKNYFKEVEAIEGDLVSVVVAPCTAKKYEIIEEDTDYVITTRELALMIRECEIDLEALKPSEFDSLLSKGSKTGLMFGRSGGVMESALNTAYYLETGKVPKEGMFHIEMDEPIKRESFKIGERIINCAVVYGMSNVEKLMSEKDTTIDFIEVMNCPQGCINGGGGPLTPRGDLNERLKMRKNIINDDENSILYPFMNQEVEEMYKYMFGNPLSNKALKFLHKKHPNLSELIK